MTTQAPLEILYEKLAHFQRDLAVCSDSAKKFTLTKEIEWTRAKIAELEGEARQERSPLPPRPKFRDAELARHSAELTTLYEKKRSLGLEGKDTRAIDAEIRERRRRLHRGPDLGPGDRLLRGRFELVESLGMGGFGRVWKAWDEETHRPVAVKVLFAQYLDERSYVERFFRGARCMAQLRHPHVVSIREPKLVDPDDGWHFFVMELVAGPDLERAVLEGGLSRAVGLRIVRQVGEALEHAHAQGLVHRDVKPSNVLLDAKLEPKLTDFDLVRADDTNTPFTATHAMMGTLQFAAPELLHSPREAGPATDVYALATTAVFVLREAPLPLGYYLNPGKAIDELDVSEALSAVLRRATSHEAGERHPSAGEFVVALVHASEKPQKCEIVVSRSAIPPKRPELSEDLFRWIETPCDGRVQLWREIPKGTFLMGSPEGEGYDDEYPQHRVTIRSSFQMAVVPVTNAQYAAFDPKKADAEWPNQPVANLSFHKATKFCTWIASTFPWARGARLPTGEEWEYACRAGTETVYWSGDTESDLDRVGWYSGNSGGRRHDVGEKPPNPWGLYDVHGGVWEWTASLWMEGYLDTKGIEMDPRRVDPAPTGGGARVSRGGSCWSAASSARSAVRSDRDPDSGPVDQGFRILLPHFSPFTSSARTS